MVVRSEFTASLVAFNSHANPPWLATEYIPPKSSQTTTGIRNWGTRVIRVPLG